MERYFIVSFRSEKAYHSRQVTTKGHYINLESFEKELGLEIIVVLNIIELSKNDYMDYIFTKN